MSFAVAADEMARDEAASTAGDDPHSQSFYNQGHNLSGTSLDSEALLDHRYALLPWEATNSTRFQLTLFIQRTTAFHAPSEGLDRRPTSCHASNIAKRLQTQDIVRWKQRR